MAQLIILIIAAAGCLPLAAGPCSRFARDYVALLAQDEAEDGARPTVADPSVVRIRFERLLGPWAQALLAAPFLAATAFWGWRLEALLPTLVALPLITVLVGACSVDVVCHRLPNRMLIWASGIGLVGALTPIGVDVWQGQLAWASLLPLGRALLTALCVLVVMTLLSLIPSGMGLGDAKLMGVLSLWLGALSLWAPAMALAVGFFIGGVAALLFMITRRAGRKDLIAFGPYLALGGWLTWLGTVI